ncbi:hypothetical protein [Streptomyces sp. NBC_01451]|uniref:hypothetical protein n=1 Tax=Streptomyces sp. NBC_01451 TaxID=2903872 RepID=UPI002E31328E|nr:hypothetical protein [Streptomyces sp. NBC_01451]
MEDTQATEVTASVLTRYRVTWSRAEGDGELRDTECIVDSADLKRPGDEDELTLVLRKILANAHMPIGEMRPENVALHTYLPICNCEPYPSPENCSFAEHRGQRFYLTASIARPGHEVIHDRYRHKILGVVCNTLSVEFLTLVQKKYEHQ